MGFKVLYQAIAISFAEFPGFLKRHGLTILLLFIPFEFIGQSFLKIASTPDDTMRMMGTIGSSVNDLLQALVIVTSVPYLASKYIKNDEGSELTVHWRRHLVQVMIESLRAMARIFFGFVLLIIPGIVLTVRYYFVPYVTQFNSKYISGELDALKHSANIIRGKAWAVLVFVLVFTLLILGLDMKQMELNIYVKPQAWAGLTIVVFLLDAFVGLASLNLYSLLEEEHSNEPNV